MASDSDMTALTKIGGGRKPVVDLKKLTRQDRAVTALVGITIVAVLLRVLSALLQGNHLDTLPGIYDQVSYDELARRVVDGYGFSFATGHWPATRAGEPTAHWSYLYTLYLSTMYVVFGAQPLVARLLQAFLAGFLHTWLIWRIGNRVFGKAVGLLAALSSAIYIYFVYYAGALITETFYILAVLWVLDCALRLCRYTESVDNPPSRSAWWVWVELGLSMGIAVLLRQAFLLFVPFLLLWLAWAQGLLRFRPISRLQNQSSTKASGWSKFVTGIVLSVTLLVSMIAPWTIRNYLAFGQFVPLNTNAGFVMFWANHPYYGTNFVGILPEDGPSYFDLLPKELLVLDEASLDRALLKEGLGFVRDDPVRYLRLSLSRVHEYFKFWPSTNSSLTSNIARVASFGLALPFILHGLVLSIGIVRRPQSSFQRSAIVLLYLFIGVYTMIHLLTWALIRYRLPVDSVLLLFAALSLYRLIGSLWPSAGSLLTSGSSQS